MLVTRAYLTHEYFICSQNVVDSIFRYYFVSEQVVFELAVGGKGMKMGWKKSFCRIIGRPMRWSPCKNIYAILLLGILTEIRHG